MGLYNQSLNENIDNVKINEHINNGGGGSSLKSEVLYTNSGTNREDIVLSKPYTDFDYLDITILKNDDSNYNDFIHTFVDCTQQEAIMNNTFLPGRTNSNIMDIWSSTNSFMRFKFTDTTHITYQLSSGLNAIYQIKGIKL